MKRMIMHPVLELERVKRGWTVKEAAEAIGVTPARWLAIVRGKGKIDDIGKLCDLFGGMDADFLFRGSVEQWVEYMVFHN